MLLRYVRFYSARKFFDKIVCCFWLSLFLLMPAAFYSSLFSFFTPVRSCSLKSCPHLLNICLDSFPISTTPFSFSISLDDKWFKCEHIHYFWFSPILFCPVFSWRFHLFQFSSFFHMCFLISCFFVFVFALSSLVSWLWKYQHSGSWMGHLVKDASLFQSFM